MRKNFLFKLGAPILALSLVAACGTDDEPDPIEEDAPQENAPQEDAPMDEDGPMEDEPMEEDDPLDDEAPLMEEDEAPLNPEDDEQNGDQGADDEMIEDDATNPDDENQQ
ncbi:hypothetical protein [Oceanobacillus salinisoli]|uniref:hypothetical protein n=1 Tax=Oceanobacillus salinisoli TaxID=2678611 RepID=UPI0012E278BC|nr:hypothetical protein [Oceanobacillus salinisoli]